MTETTPRLALPFLVAAQAQKHVTHNEALIKLDALGDCHLTGMTLTAPPASPADGDAYLVAAGATGAWAGEDGKIAYQIDGGWRFYAPFKGLTVFNAADSKRYFYTGSAWQTGAGPTTLAGLGVTDVQTDSLQINGAVDSRLYSGALPNFGGSYKGFGIKNAAGNSVFEVSQGGVVGFFGGEAFFSMGDRLLGGGFGNDHTGGFYKYNGVFNFWNNAKQENTLSVADNGDVAIGLSSYGTYSGTASASSMPAGLYVDKPESIFSGNLHIGNRLFLAPGAPASSNAAGSAGEIAVDANYVYVCTATNTWKRATLATW